MLYDFLIHVGGHTDHEVFVQTPVFEYSCPFLTQGVVPAPKHSVTILVFLVLVLQVFTEALHRAA